MSFYIHLNLLFVRVYQFKINGFNFVLMQLLAALYAFLLL